MTLKEQLEDIANRLGDVVNALQAIAASTPGTPPEPEPEPEPSPRTFTVSFKPTGVLRGVLRGPESETPVELIGSKPIARAEFFINGVRSNVDANRANGFGPWFDSRTFPNGKHVIRAVAISEDGEEAEARIEVEVMNNSGIPGPTPLIPPLIHVDASKPYSAQRGWQASGAGRYIQPAAMPLTARDGSSRIAFVDDPLGAEGKVVGMALHESDPRTSGSPRTEISCNKNLVPGELYWVGVRLLYLDENIGDQPGLFGCQCHAGDTSKGYSPSFAIIHDKNGNNTRNFRVRALWIEGRGSKYVESPSRPIPFGKWSDFVFQFREDLEGDGLCRAWQDGELFLSHTGKLGFPQRNINSYMKFGLYFWSGLTSQRRLYLKNPCIFLDDGHEQADIRAFINS